MARKLAAIAFSIGCLQAGSVLALGLGEVRLESFLNEPLKASVDLLNMGGLHEDEIRIRLAASEDFDKLGLERNYFLTSIAFNVVADGKGGARILISSEEPVLEPYLDFIVEARWPSGRLIREYTVLVDPQVFSQATPVVSASQRVEEEEGIPAPTKKNEDVVASGAATSEDDATIGAWGAEAGANSGTRVDMGKSDLSPGEMPQRSYNAATAGRPTAGSRYMISRDQTLWQIASQAKPAGVTVHQAMLDIQRLNPDAFINGNINRIKAGYIIYLPTADDISSGDVSTAVSEVKDQNAAWREGRDAAVAAARPKLTISAEPEEAVDTRRSERVTARGSAPGVAPEQPKSATGAGATDQAPLASGDTDARLAALEQQLESLQRIVSLKDDQIAALQTSLKDAGATPAAVIPAEDASSGQALGEQSVSGAETAVVTETRVEETAAAPAVASTEVTDAVATKAPASAAVAPSVEKPTTEKTSPGVSDAMAGKGWASYILYLLGALVLAMGAFVLARRRNAAGENTPPVRSAATKEDVFSAVRLQDQNLALEPAVDEGNVQPAPSPRDNRGYGERKHDQYASDVDSADALAEADIYIAYGRHQQAIDLLNNALTNEPGNPVYRLKLIEIAVERKNHGAAAAQLEKLQASGDPDSIARGVALMKGLHIDDEPAVTQAPKSSIRKPSGNGPGLPPNPMAMMSDSGESLEADFSGLEIEGTRLTGDDEDLDLSADFGSAVSDRFDDEELVIAADSNGLSTKLDLARAYLDMGDDDGARQILKEVLAEGSEELKTEARALLDRIGG